MSDKLPTHKTNTPTPPPTCPACGEHDRLWRVEEGAAYIGIHVDTLRELIKDRRIPVVKLGRAHRLRRQDLDTFIDAQTIPAVRDAG
ncbi:excisionase family DNA-binding protein [Krasilnikoviella flava]|uniref:DNA binding domain-containing protein, excisionase family n=1 Tax=Krasilnikoviella flava TaxID=526729 RepID=A0A1T5LL37_9MICO|nr:helix-turn-helix domain-containing protein [Krasilnikoviella flava]SKC76208.1 DNA binding domain-containing protein, excisionase family [Krasilnikoviella flava]